MIRVLVVDDSAFARKVLRDTLAKDREIDVVAIARDGLEALEKIAELRPDVVTLDLVMPHLDGIGVLRALPAENAPRVVVVSISDRDSELALEALHLGAVDVVQKPTALATDRLYELGDELRRKVHAAAAARVQPPRPMPRVVEGVVAARAKLVVVGTSTGGPQALTRLLASLPASFPVPIAVALHIPTGYTEALARRLNDQCALDVVEAAPGLELLPGRVVLARGGIHLKIEARGERLVCVLDYDPPTAVHFPSVDVLFESAARATKGAVLGVVLTGMGDDGLRGASAIVEVGGAVVTESESTCVVYGMPRSVKEARLSTAEARIDDMGALVLSHV